jgi:hypothetical protein
MLPVMLGQLSLHKLGNNTTEHIKSDPLERSKRVPCWLTAALFDRRRRLKLKLLLLRCRRFFTDGRE